MSELNSKREYWMNIINDFKRSGKTLNQYSIDNNLLIHQLGYWKRKYDAEKVQTDQAFIEIKNDNSINNDEPIKEVIDEPKDKLDCIIDIKIKEISISIKSNNIKSILSRLLNSIDNND